MFFNFPLVYFMLINFDLTTSAILTLRNSSGELDDSRTIGNAGAFRAISVILAWIYLIVLAGVIFALLFVIMRAKDLWAVSNRIGFVKFGVRFHSKRPILVFLGWFFMLRFLLALNLSLTGNVPELASAIIFCLLVVTSFVICVVNRLFKSLFLYLAMCVMELFLVYIGVQVVIESAAGTKQIFSILFQVAFISTQLIAMVLVVIDMVIRIIKCYKNRYSKDEKSEPESGKKLRKDLGEEDYFGLDRKQAGKKKGGNSSVDDDKARMDELFNDKSQEQDS